MPTLRTYALFICHDWEYGEDYYRICEFLNDAPNFRWKDLSVPRHDPFDNDETLKKNLRDQIRPADVVLVLAGMYAVRSGAMDFEMQFARRIGQPIIAIKPWSNVQLPSTVQRHAHEIVGWNTVSIVRAIRFHAQ